MVDEKSLTRVHFRSPCYVGGAVGLLRLPLSSLRSEAILVMRLGPDRTGWTRIKPGGLVILGWMGAQMKVRLVLSWKDDVRDK